MISWAGCLRVWDGPCDKNSEGSHRCKYNNPDHRGEHKCECGSKRKK